MSSIKRGIEKKFKNALEINTAGQRDRKWSSRRRVLA